MCRPGVVAHKDTDVNSQALLDMINPDAIVIGKTAITDAIIHAAAQANTVAAFGKPVIGDHRHIAGFKVSAPIKVDGVYAIQ